MGNKFYHATADRVMTTSPARIHAPLPGGATGSNLYSSGTDVKNMTTPKRVHNTIQPISIDDVLHYLAEAAEADLPESRTWDIGGPDVLQYGEAMQVYAEAAGLRRRVIIPHKA